MLGGTDRLTAAQGILLALVIGAVGWFTSTVVNLYRDSGASKQYQDSLHDIKAMRDREIDDMKTRISALESVARNCKQ